MHKTNMAKCERRNHFLFHLKPCLSGLQVLVLGHGNFPHLGEDVCVCVNIYGETTPVFFLCVLDHSLIQEENDRMR